MKISIGIKAFNEEANIAASIESALKAVHLFGGEVILADSGSTDLTVQIAQRYPVRVVQLANRFEASCGAGAQLAFQAARGEYFYLLDGDMTLISSFIEHGIDFLDRHSEFAGVAGRVIEKNLQGEQFQINASTSQKARHRTAGSVDRLDGGGLYRRSAIVESGYFADRNLHGFEEFDLAARLRQLGWSLARINHDAVDHYGHTLGGYRLLWRRLRSGYAESAGELVRSAAYAKYWKTLLTDFTHVRMGIGVCIWWAILIAQAIYAPPSMLVSIAVPIAVLSLRRKSLKLGLYSLASWNVSTLGTLIGIFRRRTNPREPLKFVDLSPNSLGKHNPAPGNRNGIRPPPSLHTECR